MLLKLKDFSIFLKSNYDSSGHMGSVYIFIEIHFKVYRYVFKPKREFNRTFTKTIKYILNNYILINKTISILNIIEIETVSYT